eukprot:8562978-Prorocentrum_lima.AAC.1
MITALTPMTMLQEIHLNSGLIQLTSETILHALHALHQKEEHAQMELGTCRGLHRCDDHIRHSGCRH